MEQSKAVEYGSRKASPDFLKPRAIYMYILNGDCVCDVFFFVQKLDAKMGLKSMGPCFANILSSITNKMQRYTIYLFL